MAFSSYNLILALLLRNNNQFKSRLKGQRLKSQLGWAPNLLTMRFFFFLYIAFFSFFFLYKSYALINEFDNKCETIHLVSMLLINAHEHTCTITAHNAFIDAMFNNKQC